MRCPQGSVLKARSGCAVETLLRFKRTSFTQQDESFEHAVPRTRFGRTVGAPLPRLQRNRAGSGEEAPASHGGCPAGSPAPPRSPRGARLQLRPCGASPRGPSGRECGTSLCQRGPEAAEPAVAGQPRPLTVPGPSRSRRGAGPHAQARVRPGHFLLLIRLLSV